MKNPDGWGDDELTAYFEHARQNSFASFANAADAYAKLAAVAQTFDIPRNRLHDPPDLNVPLFLFKAHASFMQATYLSMAGSIAESFMVMRGCLESALYGLYVNRNPKAMEVWASRHEDETGRRTVRATFTVARMWACLNAESVELCASTQALYEKTIDHGAHPNVASLALATTVKRADSGMQVQVAYLSADPSVIKGCMKSAAQSGVVALEIFRLTMPKHFDDLGVSARLPALRGGL